MSTNLLASIVITLSTNWYNVPSLLQDVEIVTKTTKLHVTYDGLTNEVVIKSDVKPTGNIRLQQQVLHQWGYFSTNALWFTNSW